MELIAIILVALPLIAGIANIMLANNTCDMEDDFVNRRFTLPLLIGKENALKLFSGLYVVGYLSITLAVIAGWLPLTCLLVLLTVVPVKKNIQKFKAKQTKAETFIISVQNFMMISAVYLLGLLAGFILP
jgi:1,4-dihydroxy-2-naphthoate octaprenyltransferase